MSKNKVAGPTPLTPKEEVKDSKSLPFEHQTTAYVAVMNEETKKYDMLVVKIDLRTDKTVIEREETRYDSPHRALQDTIKRVTDKLIKGGR